MFKQTVSCLSVSLLIVIAACSNDRTPDQKPSAHVTAPNSQTAMVKHVLPEIRQEKDEPSKIDTKKRLAESTLVDVADAPATIALGSVDGKRMSTKADYMQSHSLLNTIRHASEPKNREQYAHFEDNPVKLATEHPVSTFSIDVDTGSYSNVRRMLNIGQLPVHDAVRAEELINYFSYDYTSNNQTESPFAVVKEMAPSPWNPDQYLLHLGIKAQDISQTQMPNANLVFLVDVSGSMQSANKIGLLKTSLKLLSRQLTAKDKVSVVVYAGASGVVLQPTSGNQTATIEMALDQLTAGGSTNGAAGIQLAYNIAQQAFIAGGINRVILATDGDFNVGTVNHEQLMDLIENKRQSGISLSTLGFGTGNYNDHLMEQLADTGNGNYAYIDTLNEAQKVLVDEMSATLLTVAKDVKIQIEFNPLLISEYRLIGYENRQLKREDFNNDKIDAGEIGAGHTVTALYEIKLNDGKSGLIDPLRYGKNDEQALLNANTNELAYLKIRYKKPEENRSQLLQWPVLKTEIKQEVSNTSDNFRFSAAVASFAQQLRGGHYLKDFGYTDILKLARNARGHDPFGYRGEFLKLVNLAQSLSATHHIQHNQTEVSMR